MNRKKSILISLIILLIIFLYPFHGADEIRYIDRTNGEIKIEKVPGEFWLNWLYNNPLGKASLETFVKRKALSDWYGNKMDSPESAKKIAGFVQNYNIDLSIAQKQEFISFNDFFYRKLKKGARPIDRNTNVIISPADGKIFAYENIDKQDFIVKGYLFNLKKYLQNDSLVKLFKGGSLVIVRLCPTDYHRFHFPLAGTVLGSMQISGDLYSVSPIALRKKIELICMNKREYTLIQNTKIGDYIYSEVGATMVGSIMQSYTGKEIKKGQEKGYFKFGGSTVILFFKKGEIKIDEDLLNNTQKGLETAVLMGERIAIGQ